VTDVATIQMETTDAVTNVEKIPWPVEKLLFMMV
jgi:hypothetical protein